MDAFPHIAFAAKSDVGRKRKNNEDAFGTFPSLGVYCVADGMGGGDDGEIASAAAVGAVEKFVKAHPLPANAAYSVQSIVAGIRSAVNGASKWIFDRAKVRNLKGCGSTFVGVCLDPARPGEAIALHAGDSRLYRIRGRGIQQITKDHSAAELIGARNESELNPMFRGMILRAVGIQPSVEIDATPLPLKEGDCLVICSDGLCRMVPDKKIASIVRDNEAPDAAVKALVAAANEAGGIDNVTVVLVKVGKLPPPLPTVDMPPEHDVSGTSDTVGGEDSFASGDTDTNPSFDIATAESDADAASFATVTRTNATVTGGTDDQSADSTPRASLAGEGWKVMQEAASGGVPKKRLPLGKMAAMAAVAVALIVAIVLLAQSGGGEKDDKDNGLRGQDVAQQQEEAQRKVAEEAYKKTEAEMAAKMADMQRQLKEAEKKAERERAERVAEAKRLEAERKAEEEARRKAEAEAARIAAERKAEEERIRLAEERKAAEDAARKKAEQQAEEERIRLAEERKAAEERAAKEKAEREAEERRREEERQKVLAAQKKAKEEEERIAAERAAKEKAEREAEEKARRHEEEEARRKDEIMKRVLPMLEDARDYYVSDNDTLDYLRCLKRACDEGYELPANEWQAQVKDRFDRRVQFLSFHMRNKKMAEKKNLDQKKLKEEFDEIGELFSSLKYDRPSEIGKGT